MEKYFVFVQRNVEEDDSEDDDDDDEEEDDDEDEKAEREYELKQRQVDGKKKQKLRIAEIGQVLRSKGFLWMAHSHDFVGHFGQAGNIVTLETPGVWSVLNKKSYVGTDAEKKMLRKEFKGKYGDRRQELVFIGKNLDHSKIQMILDNCLLTDDEFELGVDGWKATMGDIILDDGNSDA